MTQSTSTRIPLGPFELHGRVAQGGMGEIWRGVHVAQGVPVAVKVMTSHAMQDPRYYEEFRREVQAAARLAHPSIAVVLEYGAIPPEAARASGSALVANSPYLVMEWASRGSLADLGDVLAWSDLRGLLLALLDALGHAHARGIVHRDLKPGNVLIAGEGPLDRTIRLSDFGIARAQPREGDGRVETSGLTEVPAGTPYYMAPEQVHGRFRDYGPWTDLYALGILAWELVCGELPFTADNLLQIFYLHLEAPLPPMRPRFAVPDGLDAWLARLTAKRPRDRPRFAADAAWALAQLGAPRTVRAASAPRSSESHAFWDTMPSIPGAPLAQVVGAPAPPARGSDPAPAGAARPTLELAIESEHDHVPPQPADWRGAAEAAVPIRLVGVGLGLWALRSVPLVGRQSERDLLWDALREVRLERAPRCVVLRGGAGCGKSRLAEWLVQRAHEVGAADALVASHQAVPDRRQGLARLVERRYRCGSLSAEEVIARIEGGLREEGAEEPHEARALAGLMIGEGGASTAGSAPGTSSRVSFAPTTPEERHAIVARVLARATRDRPAIVWLDDVQWGEPSLAMVRHVLARERDLPVLFVLSAREEALAARPLERDLLGAIEAQPGVRALRVSPLLGSELAALLEGELGFGGALAREVERRVDGNPLFALQLVGDWVDRGLLEVGPHGFVLRAGARPELPDDLHALWIGRVEQALAGRSALARILVELAAVLGQDVDADEFARACIALGHRFPADLLEPLILQRLIVPSESGWSFAHGLLRESLVRSARETGRLLGLHRACALMLEADTVQPGVAERLAHHLLGAGDLDAALDALALAARHRIAISELDAALSLAAEHDETARSLALAPHDPRALEGALIRAETHRLHWDFESADRVASAALEHATRAGLVRERAEALAILAHCARQKGDLPLAMSRNRTALGLFDRVDDARGRARTLLAMALVARQQSDFARSVELYERAAAVFASSGDDAGRASALLGLGNLHRVARDLPAARAYYVEARDLFVRLGNRGNLAHAVNGLAELARFEGDLDAAERGYREVLRIQTAIGSKATFIPRTNIGIVLLARGSFAEARAHFEAALAQVESGGQRGYLATLAVLLLPADAADGAGEAFDVRVAYAEALLRETTTSDPDLATAAELAGRTWAERGDASRARAAFAIARAQWTALGDAARAAALPG